MGTCHSELRLMTTDIYFESILYVHPSKKTFIKACWNFSYSNQRWQCFIVLPDTPTTNYKDNFPLIIQNDLRSKFPYLQGYVHTIKWSENLHKYKKVKPQEKKWNHNQTSAYYLNEITMDFA